ncbi:MAG: hypothetical protein K2L18_00890, partial [Acetatifactor sp.]|nr:hypothetical protein [Acetatifactor sp.]
LQPVGFLVYFHLAALELPADVAHFALTGQLLDAVPDTAYLGRAKAFNIWRKEYQENGRD